MRKLVTNHRLSDGRRPKRSERTRQAIVEAYLDLVRTRAAMVARLELAYEPELSTLSEPERTQLLVVLDILTDFESWGRLREGHGLSIEAARDVWMSVIGRMLPTVPLNPARSNPRASL